MRLEKSLNIQIFYKIILYFKDKFIFIDLKLVSFLILKSLLEF